MNLPEFLQQLLNGLTLGGTYALVALGYTLIFGVLEIVNMAHGEVFMIGAFVGYFLITELGLPVWVALPGSLVGAALVGAVLEFVALRPLRRKGVDRLAALISTIGLGLFLQNLMLRWVGPDPRSLRAPITEAAPLRLGPLQITQVQVLVLVVSVLLMLGLNFLLRRTRLGKGLRAVSENPDAAAILGVNVSGMVLAAVMLASALGGAAGTLVGLSFVSVKPDMGLAYGLKGLAVIILGGLGSVPGAVVGGLIIGLVETLAVAYGGSLWRDAVAFGFLFTVLLVRPAGLFGQAATVARRS